MVRTLLLLITTRDLTHMSSFVNRLKDGRMEF